MSPGLFPEAPSQGSLEFPWPRLSRALIPDLSPGATGFAWNLKPVDCKGWKWDCGTRAPLDAGDDPPMAGLLSNGRGSLDAGLLTIMPHPGEKRSCL